MASAASVSSMLPVLEVIGYSGLNGRLVWSQLSPDLPGFVRSGDWLFA